jgi:cytochrome P450 family 110
MNELPPGPKSALWQTLRYLRDPDGMVSSLAARYGDPFTVPTLGGPIVTTGTPEGVKAIFGADPETFSPYGAEGFLPVLGRGSILVQHGAAHRRSRKLMQPPFHHARMRAYGAAMVEITLRHFAAAPGGRFDVERLFRDISLEVILRTVFGIGEARVGPARAAVLGAIGGFSPVLALFSRLRHSFFPPWRRFVRLLAAVHEMLRSEIEARRAKSNGDGGGSDICALLVAARDEDGRAMEDQEIIEQLFTMVVAGHETTATALSWAVDELWRQPELLGRAREALRPTGGEPEKLAAEPLLDAICAETLRLRPLIAIAGRRLERPFVLGGRELPAGVGVGACLLTAHRRPELYPEPDRFSPERFLNGKAFPPHEYLPWGGGARRCLGAAFAMYELKLVLGTLILNGTLELTGPRARFGTRAATMGPKGGVKVVYERARHLR